MSASWQVEGIDLDTVDVKCVVIPTSLGSTQNIRKQVVPRVHDLPAQANLGQDLIKWGLTFKFVGPAPERYAALHDLKQLLLGNDPFTLTAPDAPNQVYFNDGLKAIDLSLDTHATDYGFGLEDVTLQVTATEA